MKIVLATGIYPPDIGGPATYVRNLAEQLQERGHTITVITYGKEASVQSTPWKIVWVEKGKSSMPRWRRYAAALKEHAKDSDIIYAFSSVSVGMPLVMSKLKSPKRILRLGGDFLWERYTDRGGRLGLRSFYVRYPGVRALTGKTLRSFDALVYSTAFQSRLSEYLFKKLPVHHVIENALPSNASPVLHEKHDMLQLLFLGRFVQFKNLRNLIKAVLKVPYVKLTVTGEGPEGEKYQEMITKLALSSRVTIRPPVEADERAKVFAEHDLLVIPSLTEISPNAALEARAVGLPVLLTEETGLSAELAQGMVLRPLKSVEDITRAIIEIEKNYPEIAKEASAPVSFQRSYGDIAEETEALFQSLIEGGKR